MPKSLVRVLKNNKCSLWINDEQRENMRKALNDVGFYVLTGADDSLEVYVIEYRKWWE